MTDYQQLPGTDLGYTGADGNRRDAMTSKQGPRRRHIPRPPNKTMELTLNADIDKKYFEMKDLKKLKK